MRFLVAVVSFHAAHVRASLADDDASLVQRKVDGFEYDPHEMIIGGRAPDIDSQDGVFWPPVVDHGDPPADLHVCEDCGDEEFVKLSRDAEAEEAFNHTTTTTTTISKQCLEKAKKLLATHEGEIATKFVDAVHDVTKWVNSVIGVDAELQANSSETFKAGCKAELQAILGPWVTLVNHIHDCGDGLADVVACAEITKCSLASHVGKTIDTALFAAVVEMEELLIMEYLPILQEIFSEVPEDNDFECPQLDERTSLQGPVKLMQVSSSGMMTVTEHGLMTVTEHVQHTASLMYAMESNLSLSAMPGLWRGPCEKLGCDSDSWLDVLHHLHGHAAALIDEGAAAEVLHAHVKSIRKVNRMVVEAASSHVQQMQVEVDDAQDHGGPLSFLQKPSVSSGTDDYNRHLTEVGGLLDGANHLILQQIEQEEQEETKQQAAHVESGELTKSEQQVERFWGGRRRRRFFKAVTHAVKQVVHVAKKVVDPIVQIGKTIAKFVRNLFSCLGIKLAYTEGMKLKYGMPNRVDGKVQSNGATISITVGVAGAGWTWDGWKWVWSNNYMDDRTSMYVARDVMQEMMVYGRAPCMSWWLKRQLTLGAAAGKYRGNCANACTIDGVSVSTKFPKNAVNSRDSSYSQCYPIEFDHLMAAYGRTVQTTGKSRPMDSKGLWGTAQVSLASASVAASCCKLDMHTGHLKCEWGR